MDVPEVVAMKTRSGDKRKYDKLERKPTKKELMQALAKHPFISDVNAVMHSTIFINFTIDFLSCFLTMWLELRDVAILDTACCGRGERTYLLEVHTQTHTLTSYTKCTHYYITHAYTSLTCHKHYTHCTTHHSGVPLQKMCFPWRFQNKPENGRLAARSIFICSHAFN